MCSPSHCPTRTLRLPVALLSGACFLLPAAVQGAAGPSLVVDMASTVVGDGEGQHRVQIIIKPASAARKAQVTAEVDAGEVVVAEGKLEATYTAPLVAKRTTATLRVTATLGSARLHASRRVRIEPPPTAAEATVSQGPFDLRIEPGSLVLGRDSSASVTFRAPKQGQPRVVVNVGRIVNLGPIGDDRYMATYIPPEKQFPQAAIVVVLGGDEGADYDWAAIPLLGMGTFQAEVTPNARVRVEVGEMRFGPFTAGAKGELDVPIVAPPGVSTGSTLVDGIREHDVDLGVPPFSRLLAVCPQSADRMLIFALSADGRPARGERLHATASIGGLGPVQQRADGVYESHYAAPPNAEVGTSVELTTTLPDVGPTTCSLRIRPPPVASIQVELSVAEYTAGTGSPIAITISARDAAGQPAHEVPIHFNATLGSVAPAVQSAPGVYLTRWRLPDAFDGQRQGHVLVTAGTGKDTVRAEAQISLKAARLTHVTAELGRRRMRANGRGDTSLRVNYSDAYGNAASNPSLVAESAGRVSPFELKQTEEGVAVAQYTPPTRFEDSVDHVRVRIDGTDAEASVEIALEGTHQVHAGALLGYSTNLGKGSAPSVSLVATAPLRAWSGAVQVGPVLSFQRSADTRAVIVEGPVESPEPLRESATTTLWLAPLLARAVYLHTAASLKLYGGLDLGVGVSRQELVSSLTGRTANIGLVPVLGVVGGAGLPLGPGRVVLEVTFRYAHSGKRIARGNVAGLTASAGYLLELGI